MLTPLGVAAGPPWTLPAKHAKIRSPQRPHGPAQDHATQPHHSSETMTETTFALIVTFTIATVLPLIILGLSAVLGPQKAGANKLEPYESGVTAPVGTARERFSVKFYLVAILFIVFDVEAVFLFPWAVNFRELGLFGLAEMFIFIGVLFAGFVYVLKKGALKWD